MTAFRLYFVALFKGGVAQCLAAGPFLSQEAAQADIACRAEAHRYRVLYTEYLTMLPVPKG